MDPEKIMDGVSKEIITTLKAMEKAKTAEERLMYSKTVRNLCSSLGVFLNLMSEMYQLTDGDDDGPIPF
ncbi:MAG: hypothetical protein U9R74_04235 [Pseudomonadota bacterium]|nr:hypothetical protein [Pseudomonadota bacterium]